MAGSTVIRELLVTVGVEVDDDGFVKFDLGMDRIKDGLGTLLKMAGAVVGAVGAVTTALALQSDATAREAVELDNLAKALGTTSQELAGLVSGAKEFGADFNDVADMLTTLADRSEDAQKGMQSFVDDFALAGIAVDDLRGKDPSGLAHLFADAIATIEDPSKRAAAAVRILGDDAGRKLLPMLMKGSAGIKAYTDEAIASGAALDDQSVAASRRYVELTRRVGVSVKGIRNQIGAALIPVMIDAAEVVLDMVDGFRELVSENVEEWGQKAQRVFRQIRDAVKRNSVAIVAAISVIVVALGALTSAAVVATAALAVVSIVGGVASVLSSVAAGLALLGGGSIAIGVLAVFGALLTLMSWIIPPALLLAAAFTGIALAVDDVITNMRGGKSVVGDFIGGFVEADGVLGDFARMLVDIGAAAQSLWGWLNALAELNNSALANFGSALIDALKRTGIAIDEFLGGPDKLIQSMTRLAELGIGGISAVANGVGYLADRSSGVLSESAAIHRQQTEQRALTVQQSVTVNGAGDPSAVGASVAGNLGASTRPAMQWLQGGAQ